MPEQGTERPQLNLDVIKARNVRAKAHYGAEWHDADAADLDRDALLTEVERLRKELADDLKSDRGEVAKAITNVDEEELGDAVHTLVVLLAIMDDRMAALIGGEPR